MDLSAVMQTFSGYVWSTPTALLLTGAGLLFTVMMRFPQLRVLTHGLSVVRGKYDDPDDEGNITHFQALSAALSGTIGLGNIAGVAVAIAWGGPGAVFWMWVVGLLGMATKFTTCSLAVMYRHRDSFGTYRGGPMYYIDMGLGRGGSSLTRAAAKSLALLFAFLGVCGCIGAGTMFQSNQVAKTFVTLFQNSIPGGVSEDGQFYIQMTVGVLLCIGVALVIIGGIERIGKVAARLVPAMCLMYVAGSVAVIVLNFEKIPEVFGSIYKAAFSPAAGVGAFYGAAVRTAMIQGVRRACFSNEAGMGTAPMAHATAKTDEPIREGVVAGIGPFIDTLIVCTMTAMVILMTDTHRRGPVGRIASIGEVTEVVSPQGPRLRVEVAIDIEDDTAATLGETLFVHRPPPREGKLPGRLVLTVGRVNGGRAIAVLEYAASEEGRRSWAADEPNLRVGTETYLFREGVQLTALAFDSVLAGFGTFFIPLAALLFAFSTMITWAFYGETCTEYLFGERAVMPFKVTFVSMIVVGASSMRLQPVLDWSDGMLGLMVIPNMIGTVLLSPRVVRASRDYFGRLAAGEFEQDARRLRASRRRLGENI